jgi:hypothetical protein
MAARKPAQVEVPDSVEEEDRPMAGVTVQRTTDDRKKTMDNSLMMALLVINGRLCVPAQTRYPPTRKSDDAAD